MNQFSKAFTDLKSKLESNNFEVFLAKDSTEANTIFFQEILAKIEPKTVSYADSLTMQSTNVLSVLKSNSNISFIDTNNSAETHKEQIYRRKEALTVDLFLTGTNAVTEKGQLVNLDMIGNRVAAITFGPRNVVLFIGKNKLVKDLDAAFNRIRTIAAPQNAHRHPNFKTPCQTTGVCYDCQSPQRLCNTWTITEKSYPKGRIKIILIEQPLGL